MRREKPEDVQRRGWELGSGCGGSADEERHRHSATLILLGQHWLWKHWRFY
jgi:hypothetical protein